MALNLDGQRFRGGSSLPDVVANGGGGMYRRPIFQQKKIAVVVDSPWGQMRSLEGPALLPTTIRDEQRNLPRWDWRWRKQWNHDIFRVLKRHDERTRTS
jgi:hypothetical protein